MGKRLIYAEDAIEAFADWFNGTEYTIMELTFSECRGVIESLPSAQPQRCEYCANFSKTRLLIPQPEKRTEERTETHSCDCISREDAKWVVFCNRDHVEDQANAIDSLPCVQPSAQPHRIKGRWIYGEHDVAMCDGYRCDKCGFFVPWDYKYTFIDFINDYHFCPNCGSDMRGEDNESSR